jgi:hypothetical protein
VTKSQRKSVWCLEQGKGAQPALPGRSVKMIGNCFHAKCILSQPLLEGGIVI